MFHWMKCLQPSLVLDSFQCNWKEICQSGPRCFEFPSICTLGNPSSHDRRGIANCDLTKERFYADPQFALVPLRGILLAQQTYVFRKCSKFKFVSCDFIFLDCCVFVWRGNLCYRCKMFWRKSGRRVLSWSSIRGASESRQNKSKETRQKNSRQKKHQKVDRKNLRKYVE